ncbi:MAG: glycoside hydrolase family 11 protein [Spirochaetales bacterium]|nr:glycoside hydrolase family 11 protein [Spirochaetales bacterium]
MKLNRILVLVIVLCLTVFTATAQTITSNSTGSQGGYWYTFWTDGGGSVSMTLGSGGQFSVQWSNCGNFVCGKGWSTGSESRTISWSGNAGNSQYMGLYGWMQNPLVEYYIPRSGGSRVGTYQADGRTWTLNTAQRVNQPSIEGTKTFTQYFCSGGGSPINFGQHCSGWRSLGQGVGSQNYQVVAIEGWGGSSGSASCTVGSSSGGGSSTTTSTSSSTPAPGSTTTSTSSSSGGGNINYRLRARSTDGQGRVNLRIGNNTIATFTLGTSMGDYTASSYNTGGINVEFFNDADNRDVQIDYLSVNGDYRQAENQSYNTAVYQNGSCGGSNSEWMHCNGVIGFGDTPGGGGSSNTTTSNYNSTTTSNWSWGGWGGWSWW